MTHHAPILIGLTGLAGSGKDTAADYLCANYGFMCTRFAGPLKAMIEQHLAERGIHPQWMHNRTFKEHPIPGIGLSARELMQRLGSAFRDADADYWVKALAQQLGLHDLPRSMPVHDRIVVADTRYLNEAAWIHRLGGHVLRLHREQAAAVRPHASEQEIANLPTSAELHNHGTCVEELAPTIDAAMARLGIPEIGVFSA